MAKRRKGSVAASGWSAWNAGRANGHWQFSRRSRPRSAKPCASRCASSARWLPPEQRLLAQDVEPGLEGSLQVALVGLGGGEDGECVERLAGEQVLEGGVTARRQAGGLFELIGSGGDRGRARAEEGGDLGALRGEEARDEGAEPLTHPARPDQRDARGPHGASPAEAESSPGARCRAASSGGSSRAKRPSCGR